MRARESAGDHPGPQEFGILVSFLRELCFAFCIFPLILEIVDRLFFPPLLRRPWLSTPMRVSLIRRGRVVVAAEEEEEVVVVV